MVGSISTLGVGSGLDLQNILDQLKEADSIPIKQKEAKQLSYKDKIEKFDSLQSKLLKAKDDALDLSLQSTYMGRSSTLSDSSVLNVDTTDGADLGSYHIKVNSLAQKSSWKSDTGVASRDALVNDTGSAETFTYEVNGKSTSVNVESGTSIAALAALINGDSNNPGVTASVIQDGSGSNSYKLLLQSSTMGESGRVTITQQLTSHNLGEETGSGGANLDAEVEIEGVAYSRGTNSIDDLIIGTTINLQKTGETTLTNKTDTTEIGDKLKSFVENLKDVLSEIESNSSFDTASNTKGAFYDVSSLRTFKSQLLNDVVTPLDLSGSITSFVDLGIEYTRDGDVTLDEDKLNSAIESNFEDVKTFLLGDSTKGITGWADTVNERLRSATSAANGIIYVEKNAAQTMYDKLATQISSDQSRLDKRYEIMTKQFLELDKYMSSMNSMSSYLTQQIESLNNASSK